MIPGSPQAGVVFLLFKVHLAEGRDTNAALLLLLLLMDVVNICLVCLYASMADRVEGDEDQPSLKSAQMCCFRALSQLGVRLPLSTDFQREKLALYMEVQFR